MSELKKMHPQINHQSEILAALHVIIEELKKPKLSIEDELWDVSSIADYLKLAEFTVGQKVVTRPEFPTPLHPCLGSKQGKKLWFAKDVIDWARKNSNSIPLKRKRA